MKTWFVDKSIESFETFSSWLIFVDFLGVFAPGAFLLGFSRSFRFRGLFVELRNA